jgi:serine protease Do
VTVTIAERPTEEELARLSGVQTEPELRDQPSEQQSSGQRSARANLGVTVQSLTPEVARSLRLTDPPAGGLVITSVDSNSDAAAKGIQTGDIILSVNQRAIRTPEEAAAAVEAARTAGRNSVLLLVRRGNAPPIYFGVSLARR